MSIIYVPVEKVGAICGVKGAKIKEITRKFAVHIEMPNKSSTPVPDPHNRVPSQKVIVRPKNDETSSVGQALKEIEKIIGPRLELNRRSQLIKEFRISDIKHENWKKGREKVERFLEGTNEICSFHLRKDANGNFVFGGPPKYGTVIKSNFGAVVGSKLSLSVGKGKYVHGNDTFERPPMETFFEKFANSDYGNFGLITSASCLKSLFFMSGLDGFLQTNRKILNLHIELVGDTVFIVKGKHGSTPAPKYRQSLIDKIINKDDKFYDNPSYRFFQVKIGNVLCLLKSKANFADFVEEGDFVDKFAAMKVEEDEGGKSAKIRAVDVRTSMEKVRERMLCREWFSNLAKSIDKSFIGFHTLGLFSSVEEWNREKIEKEIGWQKLGVFFARFEAFFEEVFKEIWAENKKTYCKHFALQVDPFYKDRVGLYKRENDDFLPEKLMKTFEMMKK